MSQYSPVANQWLQGFSETERLQQEIFICLKAGNVSDDSEANDSDNTLTELIQQQDALIRQLPFDKLTIHDVELLKEKITRLELNHKTLIEMISTRRQSLLNQSSQNKKANRSIKAYQKAQDM